jgi:hypothetical protein
VSVNPPALIINSTILYLFRFFAVLFRMKVKSGISVLVVKHFRVCRPYERISDNLMESVCASRRQLTRKHISVSRINTFLILKLCFTEYSNNIEMFRS